MPIIAPKVTTVGPKIQKYYKKARFLHFADRSEKIRSWAISHAVKSNQIRPKMTHILSSHNPAHLMLCYISWPFFVFLGPSLMTLVAYYFVR